jgi:glycosyltransferase involved in cell wall biosynthesis
VEASFGTVHRVWSPARPFRQLMIAAHAPWIASAVERFVAGRRGPHVIHGFGVWGFAGLVASRRLARRGIAAVPVVSSYTTYEAESRSKARGVSADHGPWARLRYRAEHLWILAAVERYERRAYRGARAVGVNYDSVRRLIVDRHGTGVRCRKLPYASEAAFVREGEPRPALPPLAAALPSVGAPLVVSVSRHDPRKGVDVLLHALAAVRRRGVSFRACLLGAGPLLAAHRRLATRLGLDRDVVIGGFVDDAFAYVRNADVFVLPSRREQSGSLSVLEALQAGTAVVASRCDGIPEDVVHEESALLATPGDPADLAAALERVLADGALRRRLARRGRETFAARFSADAVADGLAGFWGGLALAAGGR